MVEPLPPLANPVLHALSGPHQRFAVTAGEALGCSPATRYATHGPARSRHGASVLSRLSSVHSPTV